MTIILFFIVLAVLVLSHEFGHFIAAKKSGVRVDEFGFGFPPKIAKFKKGETTYSLNLIPFGGFVKIHGEEGQEAADIRSFASKPIWIRTIIISAGVFLNIALAWILTIIGFAVGIPVGTASAPEGAIIKDRQIIVLQIAKNSPAEIAGLSFGDRLLGFAKAEEFKDFVNRNAGKKTEIKYKRGNETKSVFLIPRTVSPPGEGAIGIALDEIGIVKMPIHKAIIEGSKATYFVIIGTAVGIANFIIDAIRGNVGLSAITGPVGIAGMVGGVAGAGFAYFLNFISFLSINLAIINILPFPALDGGRLLFLFIEKIKGNPVSSKISSIVHGAGMAVLLALMLAVTYRDIVKIF